MDRICGCAHAVMQHAFDLEWNPKHCLMPNCECISFLEVQMKVDNELPPCPFCVWDANNKAQIRMAIAVSTCPCASRGTTGEAKYLEAVVYHYGDKLEKLLENFDWAGLQKLRKQSP